MADMGKDEMMAQLRHRTGILQEDILEIIVDEKQHIKRTEGVLHETRVRLRRYNLALAARARSQRTQKRQHLRRLALREQKLEEQRKKLLKVRLKQVAWARTLRRHTRLLNIKSVALTSELAEHQRQLCAPSVAVQIAMAMVQPFCCLAASAASRIGLPTKSRQTA